MNYFGVDCVSDVRSIAQQLSNTFGVLPSWVGRYLGEYTLTAAEVSWLHANGIRILPIWNNASFDEIAGDEAIGQQQGRAAVAAARALGVPAGVAIPVDVEASALPTAAFLTGYLNAVAAAGYVGAVYLNVLEPVHVDPWIAARAVVSKAAYIYSSEPEPPDWLNTVRNEWYDFSQTLLGAAHAGDVLWHQYGESELAGTVDYDLATQEGYDLLWAPAKPPQPEPGPVRRKAIAECGLKREPAHGGEDIVTIPGGGELLDLGSRIDGWAAVQWTSLYGWIEASNIENL